MLWDIRFEWPSGARFTFNCYRHWSTLVIRDAGGGVHFINSKYGVTHGGCLYTIAYGIIIPASIRVLKAAHPLVMQLWYDDIIGDGGYFWNTLRHLESLKMRGPACGYFL